MFYFLTVGYDIHDLCMDESSDLYGPFKTAKERAKALKELLDGTDLETGTILNITLLRIVEGKLVSEKSYIPDWVDKADTEEEDE